METYRNVNSIWKTESWMNFFYFSAIFKILTMNYLSNQSESKQALLIKKIGNAKKGKVYIIQFPQVRLFYVHYFNI